MTDAATVRILGKAGEQPRITVDGKPLDGLLRVAFDLTAQELSVVHLTVLAEWWEQEATA